VPERGVDVTIVLAQLSFQLDTMAVVAHRTGVFGTTVVASDLSALSGVEVHVLETRTRARTGADGRFSFPNIRPGAYVIRATHGGFKTLFLSVAVPEKDAVELSLALDRPATKSDRNAEQLFIEMKMRLDRRSVPNSVIVPRQELSPRGGKTLDVALRYSPSFLLKGLRIVNDECIFLNGIPAPQMHLKDFLAEDVAMLEVYGSGDQDSELANKPGLAMQFGDPPCGIWAHMDEISNGKYSVRYEVRARPGLVTSAYVWLKN
jgi:Carboxypeptidase regulatory-like domain